METRLNNTQSNFPFKVLITYAVQCGILNATSNRHFRYSLFVKRIIAIEDTTSLFGLGQTIDNLMDIFKTFDL